MKSRAADDWTMNYNKRYDQTHTPPWRAAAKAGQQQDRPHPAARAAERPPTRVSSRTADTASQPMDQALGHNIIEEVNGCENKEMHAVAAQSHPAITRQPTLPMPPSHARINNGMD